MRKRIVIPMLVLLGALVALILFRSLFNDEPEYRGRKLSVWFKQYYRTGSRVNQSEDEHQEAARAFRGMGTNAVPYLLTEFYSTSKDFPLLTNIHTFLNRLPAPFRLPPFVPATVIRSEAGEAISEIKPPGDFILPLVTNRLNGPDKGQRSATIYLLCSLGAGTDEVMPFLRAMLRSTNANDQGVAVFCLSSLGRAAQPLLTDLVELIKSGESDRRAVHSACRVLGQFGNAGSNAIPALQARLAKEPQASSRINFARTLCKIDAQQTEALEIILSYAKVPGDANRTYALAVLGDIGPNAKAAVPILTEAAGAEHTAWIIAATSLLKIGETNLAISTVAGKLGHKDKQTRLNAAMFIAYYDPTHSLAISNLVEFARDPFWGRVAIEELAKLRPVSELGVSTLRAIAADKKNEFHQNAAKALQAMKDAEDDQRKAR